MDGRFISQAYVSLGLCLPLLTLCDNREFGIGTWVSCAAILRKMGKWQTLCVCVCIHMYTRVYVCYRKTSLGYKMCAYFLQIIGVYVHGASMGNFCVLKYFI